MDKKSVFIWGAVVLILAGIAAAVYFYIKKQREAEAARVAEAERQAAEAAALAAANQALIDAQTNTLNELFPDEANLSQIGTGTNGLQNATPPTPIDANSTGGQQLIRQSAALLASNAATWQTAKNRAGVAEKIFAGVDDQSRQKMQQALMRQLQWSGQPNDFPVPNKYGQLNKYNEVIAKGQAVQNYRGIFNPQQQRAGGPPPATAQMKQDFNYEQMRYSLISDSGQPYASDYSATFNGNGYTQIAGVSAMNFAQNWAAAAAEADVQLTAIAVQLLIDQGKIYFPAQT